MRKSSKKTQQKRKDVPELDYHQISTLVESFFDKMKIGPEYICTFCDQLWYRSSFSLRSKSSFNKCSKDNINCCVKPG